jgi:hypothetical protein
MMEELYKWYNIMKCVLLLSGLHYREYPTENINYKHYTIDYRYYVKNIKTYLFNLGDIDVYAVTNDSPIVHDLVKFYNPVKMCIMDDTVNRRISKTWRGLELIRDSGLTYDYVCITRFDIYFMKPIELNYEKINVFSHLEVLKCIDDNFYFMPWSLFPYFMSVFDTIKDNGDCCASHHLKIDNVHYICNEKDFVHNLTSFKLRFFKSSFSLNNLYTEDITYKYSNYTIYINNGKIHLNKQGGSSKAGFHLLLNVGDYFVKHVYTSNINIYDYLLLNNKRYGNNSTIHIKKPTTIYFIFDMMNELNIVFHSIAFVKQTQQLFKYH